MPFPPSLTNRDRAPWLAALRALLSDRVAGGENTVLACSALKARAGHYMKAGLLESQFGALEEPEDALVVNVDRPLREVVACILGGLRLTTAVKEIQEAQETL